MLPNRIMRRGARNRRLAAAALTLILVAALAGCGGGGSSTAPATTAPAAAAGSAHSVDTPSPSPEQAADGEILDKVLSRQEAAIDAYAQVIPALPPRLRRMAAYFRAQEQEHVDAVLKAMRALQVPAEPTAEPIEPGELKSERERLLFLYEVEGATIDEELSAISKLEAAWPRSLLASTVGNQAQHLTLLRKALGAGPLASVPVPFEDGTTPPPE